MADQTPDPTAWDDDQLDNLLDALAERAAERDDLDLPASGPTRRTVLATLLGAGGLGVGATQLGAAASWGSASGTVGTQSEPLDTANIRDLDSKLLEAEQRTLAGETRERVAGPTDFAGGTFDVSGLTEYDRIEVIFRAEGDDNPSEIQLQINNDTGSNYEYREFNGANVQTTTGDTKIRVADVGDFHQVSGRLILYDVFGVRESPAVTAKIGSLVSLRTLESGYRQTFTPTESLQLINTNGSAARATATVWGITDF